MHQYEIGFGNQAVNQVRIPVTNLIARVDTPVIDGMLAVDILDARNIGINEYRDIFIRDLPASRTKISEL